MKIVTWNINSIRLRIDLIAKLAREEDPDLILLQETKVENISFPEEACRNLGFDHLFFDGEKSYNGVAILSKIPFDSQFSLKFYNEHKRHVAVKIKDIEVHNFYIPSGGDIPDTEINNKFLHKLEYLKELKEWFRLNRETNRDKIILAGDLNIAPLEHDVWSSRQLRNEVSHTDVERKLMMDIIKDFSWQDIGRNFVPKEQKLYSWWSYRNRDWSKSNRGRRLDHIWLSEALAGQCREFSILKEARSYARPSDHVPVIAIIEN